MYMHLLSLISQHLIWAVQPFFRNEGKGAGVRSELMPGSISPQMKRKRPGLEIKIPALTQSQGDGSVPGLLSKVLLSAIDCFDSTCPSCRSLDTISSAAVIIENAVPTRPDRRAAHFVANG